MRHPCHLTRRTGCIEAPQPVKCEVTRVGLGGDVDSDGGDHRERVQCRPSAGVVQGTEGRQVLSTADRDLESVQRRTELSFRLSECLAGILDLVEFREMCAKERERRAQLACIATGPLKVLDRLARIIGALAVRASKLAHLRKIEATYRGQVPTPLALMEEW